MCMLNILELSQLWAEPVEEQFDDVESSSHARQVPDSVTGLGTEVVEASVLAVIFDTYCKHAVKIVHPNNCYSSRNMIACCWTEVLLDPSNSPSALG